MRKISIIASLSLAFSLLLTACGSESTTNNPPTLGEAVSVEVMYVKNDAGQVIEEYQMDKIRKLKHGYEKSFYSNGKLMLERNYKLGQAEGKELSYHENGQLKSEVINQNNRRNGAFKHYYDNGKLEQEGIYKDDGIEGVLKVYYNTGSLKETVTYKDGKENGEFIEYNPNGSLKAKGNYLTNDEGKEVENGLLELYDENGKLTSKMDCEMGVCYTVWTVEKGNITPKKLPKPN